MKYQLVRFIPTNHKSVGARWTEQQKLGRDIDGAQIRSSRDVDLSCDVILIDKSNDSVGRRNVDSIKSHFVEWKSEGQFNLDMWLFGTWFGKVLNVSLLFAAFNT